MNIRVFNGSTIAMILIFMISGCSGTSTDEYLDGDFIENIGDATPPSAILPVEGSIVFNSKTVLQWTAKKKAEYYTVEVAQNTNADFSTQIPGSPFRVDAPDTMLSVELPAASATYCWRVRADITSAGQYGKSYFESMDDSIYVYCPASGTAPDDTGMVGNISKPFRTITRGIAEADKLNLKTVKVAARGNATQGFLEYNEVVVLKEAINLYGGYTSNFTESARNSVTNKTIIKGEHGMTVRAKDIVLATVFDGFYVQAQDDGVNSFAIHIDSCYFDLFIQNCNITGAVSDSDDINSYAIYVKNSFITIQNNTIDGGNLDGLKTSIYGIACFQSDTVIYNNTITGGNASTDCIGIYNYESSPNISGNSISGGDYGYYSYGIYTDAGNPEIRNNEIAGGSFASVINCGVRFVNDCISLVMNNTITGNSAGSKSYGAFINDSANVSTFINNVIKSGYSYDTYGFYIEDTSPYVLNNTIIGGDAANNSKYTSYGMMINDSDPEDQVFTRPMVYNNIITTIETYTPRYGIYGEPWGHSNNCYYAPEGTGSYHYYPVFTLDDELAVDPDLSPEDDHLQFSSHLNARYGGLDLYTNDINPYPFNTDRDGDPRSTGTNGQSFGDGWSMGAFEY